MGISTDNSSRQVSATTRTIVRTCIGTQCSKTYPRSKANWGTANWTPTSSSTPKTNWATDRTPTASSTQRSHGDPTNTGPARDV
jgi:hypothetical protein